MLHRETLQVATKKMQRINNNKRSDLFLTFDGNKVRV